MRLGLERQGAESLFVLGDVLAEHVPQGLGLLGTQVDCLVVFDSDLVGTLTGSQSKDELEIPHADANLDAVGVGFAVIGRLGEIELRLRGWTHDFIRLLCRGDGALPADQRTHPYERETDFSSRRTVKSTQ